MHSSVFYHKDSFANSQLFIVKSERENQEKHFVQSQIGKARK